MATGPYAAISSYDNSGTQALAVTDKINDTGDLMSVFWNKNDTFKQIIHGYSTVQVPSSVSTKDASWGKTQTFEISKDADALGNIYLSIVVDLDIPETPLNYGPPQTLTTLLRRPSSKESITLWDLTEPIMYRIRGTAKDSNKPQSVQIGYPNGWREDTSAPNYPSPLNNLHPFMQAGDIPSYPEWDWKPRDFLQLENLPLHGIARPTLVEFLDGTTYLGGNTKEYLFNPDMRVSKHARLELFSDREEYSLGDPRPMSILMNGYYSKTLKESPNYIGHDNLISDSLVSSVYQTTYRPHDLSYIPKYLSFNDSKKLLRTGNEHIGLNTDGKLAIYSSPGILADDFFISYLSCEDVKNLVNYYNYSDIRPINKLITPPDNRSHTSNEFLGLPGMETTTLFGSQDGKSPSGWPNKASNHTFDKGEYLFSKTGEFISNNTDNPPDGSYSFSLDRIDPIEDAPDVLPSHQNFDHYGYATTISKDGSTLVVSQGRMYGCEQSSNNQTLTDNLHQQSANINPQSNPADQYWPYGQEDASHTSSWSSALNSGAILFPSNPKRAGKVRLYKKNGDNWVLNKVFSASDSNLASYPYGAKSIKRPGTQEYIYIDPINPKYISPGDPYPVLKQKTPWAPGCKHHISLNGDGTRLVIGEAGGPNNAVNTYDYKSGIWILTDYKTDGNAAMGGVADVNNNIEQYYTQGVYTGNNDYTFNNSYGIYPLPESVWGSGFGNNVQLSEDGNKLAVTSYMSPAQVFKWENSSWVQMGTGITGIADSISMTNNGTVLVTANFTNNSVYVWEYDINNNTWNNSDVLNLRNYIPNTESNNPRGTAGANNALSGSWSGASAVVSIVSQGPGTGGNTICSSPVRISGDGSRIVIGAPRALGEHSNLEPGLLKIYTKLSLIGNLPYTSPGAGHPNWVQINDSNGNPQQINMEPGEFSISYNGNKLIVGSPVSNTYLTSHLPEFPTQAMLLGVDQTYISKEYPWTSSANISEKKKPKLEAGKIKIYDYMPTNIWVESMGEINGESGEINKGDSHSHTSSQNFHNMFLATGGINQGSIVNPLLTDKGLGIFYVPSPLNGNIPVGQSMTIAASCKFLGFGTDDSEQAPIITLGSSGSYGRFSIQPLNFDNTYTTGDWDLIGVTFHAADGGYIYPPIPGMNEKFYSSNTRLATELGTFLAYKGDTNFYVVSKSGGVISFYVNGNLIGFHDYTAEETAHGQETYGDVSYTGWDGGNAPDLYYYCGNHSGMGGIAYTPVQNTYGTVNYNVIAEFNTYGSPGGLNYGVTYYFHMNGAPAYGNASNPTIELIAGKTYIFTVTNSSSQTPPPDIRFSTTLGGTHGGGVEYTTGVTVDTVNNITTFVVPENIPHSKLYYYPSNNSYYDNSYHKGEANIIIPELIHSRTTTNLTVTHQNVGGNKYFIDGQQQPNLELLEGNTYVFDWSSSPTHPFRLSTTSGGTHSGGVEYTTGVTVDTVNYTTTIRVGNAKYLNAVINNVGAWDGALTQSEIITMYNNNAELSTLTNGANATLISNNYASITYRDSNYDTALYNSIRYDGDLARTWEQPWHKYGGIDFIKNYFSVNGGYEHVDRDLVYSGQIPYNGNKGEGLGWSIAVSGDGNTIVSGAPYMSTIGTTSAIPRRSYNDVGRAYIYTIKKSDKTIYSLPKRNPGEKLITYDEVFKLVNETQIKLNHDITDFVNLPDVNSKYSGSLQWTKQWDTVPDQAVKPPELEDFINPYWAKSNLKTKVNNPLSKIIKRIHFLVGTQVWQTLENEDLNAIHATELSESTYKSLQLQCSGYVRSDGTREKTGDLKWAPGKKYQAIIPIPVLSGNSKQCQSNYSSHYEESYLNFLSREQRIKIRVEYADVKDIFDTSNLYAYQGYEASIYTLYSSDKTGRYITNVPEIWKPNIKLSTTMYADYISISDEEKAIIKAKQEVERINKRIKVSQNITFDKFPDVLHREMYLDIKLDTFSLYSSHLIISLDFPEITNKNKIPYLQSAEIFLNGTTHSGRIPSSGLIMGSNSLGLYSNQFGFDKQQLDKIYYVFPLGSRAFGASSIPLNRIDDILLQLFFTVNNGIPDEGIPIPENSRINITCRGETSMFYYDGGSSITLY
tara:strand:+ start:7693 stop:13992 length:6300 start_codon:yes stop_codon:yes gene_type:complete